MLKPINNGVKSAKMRYILELGSKNKPNQEQNGKRKSDKRQGTILLDI